MNAMLMVIMVGPCTVSAMISGFTPKKSKNPTMPTTKNIKNMSQGVPSMTNARPAGYITKIIDMTNDANASSPLFSPKIFAFNKNA